MSNVISKKIYPWSFDGILSGEKTFELRLADWDCEPGDILELVEITEETRKATGRVMRKRVGTITKTKKIDYWPPEDVEKYGYQIISLLDEERA